MRIPQQVAERVKEAPAQALRTVFSGIGQVLLVADRIKSRAAEPERAQPAAAAARAQSTPGQGVAKDETRRRSPDETGNVRLLSEEDQPPARPAAGPAAAEAKAPAAEAKPPTAYTKAKAAAGAEAKAAAAHAQPAAAEPATPDQAALPVPNYDDLSLASLRARLRNLDQSQVRVLLEYEKGHAGRPDVLAMFERRIAKLESGGA